MELVNWQYSGAEHGVVKGICVVNAIWQTSKDEYTPIDYRIWNPSEDGKTKNNHFIDLLSSAKNPRQTHETEPQSHSQTIGILFTSPAATVLPLLSTLGHRKYPQ